MEAMSSLPWRGPGPGRPALPLPPDEMPLRRGGRWRKRWRYVGAYCDELLLCAARVQVGKLGQTFWAIWDREGRQMWEHTRPRFPGARGEAWTEKPSGAQGIVDYAPDEGLGGADRGRGPRMASCGPSCASAAAAGWSPSAPAARASTCGRESGPTFRCECDVRIGERRWRVKARGVEDESAGYHPHHTVWSWSAGVGVATDGRSVGWNLVSGINDPPERSERAIWVDGEPSRARRRSASRASTRSPSTTARGSGSAASASGDGEENRLLVALQPTASRSAAFTGTLPGGLELDAGLGVMEHHDAHW